MIFRLIHNIFCWVSLKLHLNFLCFYFPIGIPSHARDKRFMFVWRTDSHKCKFSQIIVRKYLILNINLLCFLHVWFLKGSEKTETWRSPSLWYENSATKAYTKMWSHCDPRSLWPPKVHITCSTLIFTFRPLLER